MIADTTVAVWSEEFLRLDAIEGAEVLEFLQSRPRPPAVYEVQRAITTIQNRDRITRDQFRQAALNEGQGQEIKTFGEWAADPRFDRDKVEKLIKVVGSDSYSGKRMIEGLARRQPTVDMVMNALDFDDETYDPPCDKCGQRVANGPNSQARYDSVEGKWINAHIDCFKMEVRRAKEADRGDGGADGDSPEEGEDRTPPML